MNEAAVVILVRLVLGLLLSSIIGWLAYQRKSLTAGGVAGAILTGTIIFGLGGIACGCLLVVFFVTASALSHYKGVRKRSIAEQFDKGSQRDLGQALANGAVAALFALCSGLAWLAGTSTVIIIFCFTAIIGALASANADTWATELGVLSRSRPRLITDLSRVVEPGTSGGVTRDGTLAAAAGALVIGVINLFFMLLASVLGAGRVAWLLLYNAQVNLPGNLGLVLAVAALFGGVVGTLADSYLGATVQAMYFDTRRNRVTERRCEPDGTTNRLLRGRPWFNNDWVNFAASLAGATVACATLAGALLLATTPRN
jgi:uncharacterized protein (TIGR00297 family)